MFYLINKWLFIISAKRLIKQYRACFSESRSKRISKRAKDIDGYLIKLIQEVSQAGEFAVSFMIDQNHKNDLLNKLSEDIKDKSKDFSEASADTEDSKKDFFAPETTLLITTPESELLMGFDIESEDSIYRTISTVKEDADKALNDLRIKFGGEADIDGDSV
ncbi:hypothetical protein [Candidatus Mycoplasma haematohominis]|uniref:Uncharacterized protein n=1 Tax=Candidatus Mycoplasma haematohominis TaxID=1494318 RepID=A0A478FTH0_9MOLU|nr:hypothetical protein [Candidatus Mycoplasma haemohominis]GCE63320.1 hypothetical protein MHSWG343_03090 [Candidatus Mycoplasma haemohominis]